MSDVIHYTCRCGAAIRVPSAAAGKRARCKTCGEVFTVPAPATEHAHAPSRPQESIVASDRLGADEAPDTWLRQLYEGVPPGDSENEEEGQPEAVLAPQRSRRPATQSEPAARSFWRDFMESPIWLLRPVNLITLVTLVGIGFILMLMPFGGCLGLFGSLFLYGYMCSLYLTVIVDTAAGEDHLAVLTPTEAGDNYLSIAGRMLGCIFQFVGTFAWALAPAICLGLLMWHRGGTVNWPLVQAAGLCCLVLWPAVILGVAIGGGFNGLWPHTIIRTAFAAPLPYLAICAAAACAYLIMSYREVPFVAAWLARNFAAAMTLRILDLFIGPYCMLTCMRVIGLYYRHFKHRFPWAAE